KMRLRLLTRRGPPLTQDPVRDNAYAILQQVMRVSNDWMVLKSTDHRFLLATNNFCHAFALSVEEVIGKNDMEIGTAEELVLGKPGTDWIGYWEQDTKIMESGEEDVRQPLVVGDDEVDVVREKTIRTPLKDRDGNVFSMLVCVSEVSHPKDAGDNISIGVGSVLQRSSFARSPALLAMEREKNRIDELRRESENAFIAKNQFIASASHDLRQPLHALGLFISALERRETDSVTENLIEKLKHCSESINDLLNGLLDISQLDANVVTVDLKHFPIDELFVTLFDESINRADNKGLDLKVHSDQSIVCSDTLLLGRILRNLLTNAINYTDSGLVSMSAFQNQNQVEITVADTGRGIPEQQQEAVFKEFHQLTHKKGPKSGGLGLGLAIVRRLCLLLDIELRLDSRPGAGTRFTLMLPLGERSKIDASLNGLDGYDSYLDTDDDFAANILVIDDDSTVREAVEVILQTNNCSSMAAESPGDAVTKIESSGFEPDLILADFRLKDGQTGIDAVTRIQALLELPIPAIIITGDTSDIGLQELNQSGIRYLHKPVSAPELMEAVKSLLLA
nr:hybrid sensor histidine kinase/response regulator [Granulosicoccus sp.]